MTTLKFVDTHNMVMFLSKPAESEGLKQIVDFLNAHIIKYALTVNPTIYTSCIEQLWATVKAKTVNGEVQLQALVDGKKIIIIESIVRRDLQLEDAEGVDSTNQKFNFLKYIFESMVKNLDNVSGIFLMYPRFVQVFVNQQLERMPTHKRIYISPSHTKKIFRNMRRVGKGFSGRETPLFQTMVVQDQAEMGEGSAIHTDPHHTPTFIQPSTSQPQKKQRSRRSKRKDIKIPQPSGPTTNVADEAVNEEIDDSLERAATTATSLDAEQDRRQEIIGDTIAQTRSENVSKLSNDPLLARATEIASLKKRVKKLERRNKSRTHGLKRLYKFGSSRRVESSGDKEDLGEDASRQGRRIHDIDVDEDITLVNDDNEMFDVGTLTGDEVLAEQVVAAKDVNLSVDEVTLAQVLSALKSTKVQEKGDVIKEPSVPVSAVSASTKDSAATTITATIPTPRKGIVFQEPSTTTTTTTIISSQQLLQANVQDQGKGKMEVRLAREKAEKEQEANVALTEEWDNIQANHELAQRLQAQKKEEFSDAEKATLFVQLLEKRRKHFAAKREEEK
ncbi:hypothetical protein Tco_1088268 [Tanacetum coccineum]